MLLRVGRLDTTQANGTIYGAEAVVLPATSFFPSLSFLIYYSLLIIQGTNWIRIFVWMILDGGGLHFYLH